MFGVAFQIKYLVCWSCTAAVAAGSFMLASIILPASHAKADGPPRPRTIEALVDNYPFHLWRETWVGAEVLARSWSVYTGSTVALTGDIDGPGWRVRSSGGYGQYTYRKWTGTRHAPRRIKFTGAKTFSDALVGYHGQWDRMTWKVFAGFTSEQHRIDPRDLTSDVTGFSYGGKIAMETWTRINKRTWVSLNASWNSAFNTFKAELATGYAVLDNIDVGIETRFEGDDAFDAGRLGALATWRVTDEGGMTIAGGVTGDRDQRTTPYARLSIYYKY